MSRDYDPNWTPTPNEYEPEDPPRPGVLENPKIAQTPREVIHMATAILWSGRSMCSQPNRRVGAIITTGDMRRVLSVGYNGPGKKLPEDYCFTWRQSHQSSDGHSRCPCTHAEANAIAFVDSTIVGKILFCTLEPCEPCAHLILNANIDKIFYLTSYRLHDGLAVLERAGVQTIKMAPQVVSATLYVTANRCP